MICYVYLAELDTILLDKKGASASDLAALSEKVVDKPEHKRLFRHCFKLAFLEQRQAQDPLFNLKPKSVHF